jgi:hypothetical protein
VPPPAIALRVIVNRALLWANAVLEISRNKSRNFMSGHAVWFNQ